MLKSTEKRQRWNRFFSYCWTFVCMHFIALCTVDVQLWFWKLKILWWPSPSKTWHPSNIEVSNFSDIGCDTISDFYNFTAPLANLQSPRARTRAHTKKKKVYNHGHLGAIRSSQGDMQHFYHLFVTYQSSSQIDQQWRVPGRLVCFTQIDSAMFRV